MLWLFLLILIFFISVQPKREDWLSLESTNSLRGLLAIMIILHHIAFAYPYSTTMATLGTEICAVFFMLSGYALRESRVKKSGYMKRFPLNNILKLLLEYAIVNVIFVLYFIFVEKNDFKVILELYSYMKVGATLVTHSWFIVSILAMYVIFFLAFRWCDNFVSVIIFSILLIGYIVFVYMNFNYTHWYASILAFPAGMLISRYKSKLETLMDRFGSWVIIASFALAFIFRTAIKVLPDSVSFAPIMLMNLFWAFTVILATRHINTTSKITTFLGGISLEVYLMQGIAEMFSERFFDTSKLSWAVCVLILAVILGFLLSLLMKPLNKKLFGKKNG